MTKLKTLKMDGITTPLIVKIGENASDNWTLIDEAEPDYYWFHLTKFPSSHVILCHTGDITKSIILECATLCKEHSKYKNLKNVKVDYTHCKNLIKGSKVGEVYFKKYRNVRICVV